MRIKFSYGDLAEAKPSAENPWFLRNPFSMIENHLKIAWRTLYRQWQFSLISITGLVIGLACCILIAVYVRHEYSYDRYHVGYRRGYLYLARR